MKIDFTQTLHNLDGEPLKDEKDKPLTLAVVSTNALLAPDDASGDDKMKRWKLTQRIHGSAEPVTVTAEEVSQIKTLIGKGYAPLVVGQAFEMLEQEYKEPEAPQS